MNTRAPGRTASRIVGLSVLALPRSTRDRYLLEFTAELHFIPRDEELQYAFRVLMRTWSLRAALSGASSAPIGEAAMTHASAPWHCRLHIWHHWRTFSAEDGGRYRACHQCGRERDQGYIPPGAAGLSVG